MIYYSLCCEVITNVTQLTNLQVPSLAFSPFLQVLFVLVCNKDFFFYNR